MFELNNDDQRKKVINTDGPMLIMGGPGSGKTTIALFKAKNIIDLATLEKEQKVLFLSFARATISRVEEQAGGIISKKAMKFLEINTYHGFAWNLLKNHGYLLNSKLLKLLPPHEAAAKLSGINKKDYISEIRRLFVEEGIIHFDLFASLCAQLLTESNALQRLICSTYPIIILDEFQDTNLDEWGFISVLGKSSRLIALADPEQRIYDFRGADPKRISEFIEKYKPSVFDFGIENNRSSGTDIVQFGNDLLTQANKKKAYHDVEIKTYAFVDKSIKHIHLKYLLLQVYTRISKTTPDWSIAILVPTNALMLEVSDFLSKKQILKAGKTYPPIPHEVAIESAGPSLSGTLIANLLEEGSIQNCKDEDIINALCNHILGRRGTKAPPQKDIELVNALMSYLSDNSPNKKIRGKVRCALVQECAVLSNTCNLLVFSGNVANDWLQIRRSLEGCSSPYIQQVANDAKYLRLLRKGSQLNSTLNDIWRNNGTYLGARNAVSNALTQEHFAMTTRTWNGINVMTIHKAKGKEFDEVIIYEGRYHDRIVSAPERSDQARLNLRVAVTRAKKHTTILTPSDDPCPLL